MTDDELQQIGAVAERVGLSLRTIRHYEEVGLVTPSGRSAGGFRLYTDADVERLERVKVMKPLGFTLEETAEILELLDRGDLDDAGLARLGSFAERAEQRVVTLGRQLELARSFSASLRQRAEPTGPPSASERTRR